MPVPIAKDDRWMIERREIFKRLQRKARQAGQKNKNFNLFLGETVVAEISIKAFFTRGVIKCLRDEWERGQNESS